MRQHSTELPPNFASARERWGATTWNTQPMAELDGVPVTLEAMQALALTNYGHFTSMRVEDFRVRGLDLHLKRLRRDCQALFDTDLDTERVRHLVRQAIAGRADAIVARVTVYDPTLELGRPGKAASPKVLVTTRPAVAVPQPPMRVQTTGYERDLPAVKHVGLLGLLYQRRSAQLAGFDDTLFVDNRSMVSEGGTWNLGLVAADGTLIWPKADVLPGVTLELLSQVYDGPVTTQPVRIEDLSGMQLAFATNAAFGVRAIHVIDDTALPVAENILADLQDRYVAIEGDTL